VNSWLVIPLTLAAVGVCWLLAWIALLLVFMWLVRRRCDPDTLKIFVKLAESWRMPATPLHVLASRAGRREAARGRDRRRRGPGRRDGERQ
jgi:hypothetical protein